MDATLREGGGSDAWQEPDGGQPAPSHPCPDPDAAEPDGDQALACPDTVVQIAGIPFNANTIVTTAACGAPLTPIDGTMNGNEFATANEAVALYGSSDGLPNNAHFTPDASTIPCVQLAWTDAKNVLNSVVLPFGGQTTPQTTAKVSLPTNQQAAYHNLQIYAIGGNAGSTSLSVSYTLTYETGSPSSSSVDVPDWCFPTNTPAVLATAQRVQGPYAEGGVEENLACNIYAIPLSVDSSRTLTDISFSFAGPNSSFFVFYGATAW